MRCLLKFFEERQSSGTDQLLINSEKGQRKYIRTKYGDGERITSSRVDASSALLPPSHPSFRFDKAFYTSQHPAPFM